MIVMIVMHKNNKNYDLNEKFMQLFDCKLLCKALRVGIKY